MVGNMDPALPEPQSPLTAATQRLLSTNGLGFEVRETNIETFHGEMSPPGAYCFQPLLNRHEPHLTVAHLKGSWCSFKWGVRLEHPRSPVPIYC